MTTAWAFGRSGGYIYSSNWRSSDGPFIHQINGKPIPLVELPKDSVFDDTAYDMYTESVPTRASLRAGPGDVPGLEGRV